MALVLLSAVGIERLQCSANLTSVSVIAIETNIWPTVLRDISYISGSTDNSDDRCMYMKKRIDFSSTEKKKMNY